MFKTTPKTCCAFLSLLIATASAAPSKADEGESARAGLAAIHKRVQRFRCTYVLKPVKAPKSSETDEKLVRSVEECAFDLEKRRYWIDQKATTSSGRQFRKVWIDNGDECYSANYDDGVKLSRVSRQHINKSQTGGLWTPSNFLGLGCAKRNFGELLKDWTFSANGTDESSGSPLLKVRFFKPGLDGARDYLLDPSRSYLPAAGEIGATKRDPPQWKFKVLAWGKAKDVSSSGEIAFPASIERTLRRTSGENEVILIHDIVAEINGRLPDSLFAIDLKSLPPGVQFDDSIDRPRKPLRRPPDAKTADGDVKSP